MNADLKEKLAAAKAWMREQGIDRPRVKVSHAVWPITRVPARLPEGLTTQRNLKERPGL